MNYMCIVLAVLLIVNGFLTARSGITNLGSNGGPGYAHWMLVCIGVVSGAAFLIILAVKGATH